MRSLTQTLAVIALAVPLALPVSGRAVEAGQTAGQHRARGQRYTPA